MSRYIEVRISWRDQMDVLDRTVQGNEMTREVMRRLDEEAARQGVQPDFISPEFMRAEDPVTRDMIVRAKVMPGGRELRA